MNEQTKLTFIQLLLTYGPTAFNAGVEFFHKTDPTKDDFLALGNSVSQESYDSIIAARRAAAGGAV